MPNKMRTIVLITIAWLLVAILFSLPTPAQTVEKKRKQTNATKKKTPQTKSTSKKTDSKKESSKTVVTKDTQHKKVTTSTRKPSTRTVKKTPIKKTSSPKVTPVPSERATSPPRKPDTHTPNPALVAAFHRIVMARLYQDTWTLPDETPESVGEALASLKPSTVAGLIRLGGQTDNTVDGAQAKSENSVPVNTFSPEQAAAFNTIRKKVREVNPECRFDFVLNVKAYSTSDAILAQMKDINAKVNPDLWFFDSLTSAYKTNPAVIDAAITYAHSKGQAVGGDCYSAQLPTGIDYAVVETTDFKFDLDHIRKIRETYHIPVIAHLNYQASAQGKDEESKRFIQTLTLEKRVAVITHLASGQNTGQYAFMYPVFFPQPASHHFYNANKDGTMLDTYRKTMDLYNP